MRNIATRKNGTQNEEKIILKKVFHSILSCMYLLYYITQSEARLS